MQGFDSKRIADPVHGTIGLSELEVEIINTPVFQRLRNVKQLGLANLVFPGADYSRFSHSIGVCHVTGSILENLRRNSAIQINDDEIQIYRLAGLLHDVGHYPFSHAMEHAITNYYSSILVEGGNPVKYYKHESVSKRILEKNKAINAVLNAANIDPAAIYKIFNREEPPRFANLISSDLDADRIDYLMRTAHHTGLPYGSVDLPYLLSQMKLDVNNRICVTSKALRTVEHFLLGRYFDYQQVVFHKTVVSMEWLLKEAIVALLESGMITGVAEQMTEMIENESWDIYDDTHVIEKIRALSVQTNKLAVAEKAKALIQRRPPKLVGEIEYFAGRQQDPRMIFLHSVQTLKEKIASWAAEFSIPEEFWHLWQSPMSITKIGSHIPLSSGPDGVTPQDKDNIEQAVYVCNKDNQSTSIMEHRSSLMNVLSNYALYSIRLYILVPADYGTNLDQITAKIKADLPNLQWK